MHPSHACGARKQQCIEAVSHWGDIHMYTHPHAFTWPCGSQAEMMHVHASSGQPCCLHMQHCLLCFAHFCFSHTSSSALTLTHTVPWVMWVQSVQFFGSIFFIVLFFLRVRKNWNWIRNRQASGLFKSEGGNTRETKWRGAIRKLNNRYCLEHYRVYLTVIFVRVLMPSILKKSQKWIMTITSKKIKKYLKIIVLASER